jgi:hypothetical protein
MQEEYYFGLSVHRDIAEGRTDYSEVVLNDAQRGEKPANADCLSVASWSRPHCQNITA